MHETTAFFVAAMFSVTHKECHLVDFKIMPSFRVATNAYLVACVLENCHFESISIWIFTTKEKQKEYEREDGREDEEDKDV